MPSPTKQELAIIATFKDGVSGPTKKAGETVHRSGQKMDKALRKAETRFGGTAKSAVALGGAVKKLLPHIAALVGVGAGLAVFSQSARAASEFSLALSEVSTLVDTSVVDMQALRDGVLEVSNTLGATPIEATKGLYQTISSGAVEAGEAIEFLAQSQKLAVAGVATTAQAVDVLTTAINAYGVGADKAAEFSDILFETVKQGKTTLPELAGSLGRAIPIASSLGVELDELTAATAALTKGGFSTDEAVTSLRAAMAALISPQQAAQVVLRELNVDISKSRIEAVGFAQVLDDLARAVDGDTKKLKAIFPELRGLTGVLALTGKQAKDFDDVLGAIAGSAGATGEAFDKQMADPARRAQLTIQTLKNEFLRLGDAVLLGFNEAIVAAGGVEKVAENLGALARVMGAVFGNTARSIAELSAHFTRLIDKAGGAEGLSRVAEKVVDLVFEVSRAVNSTIADAIITLVKTLADVGKRMSDVQFAIENFSIFGSEGRPAAADDALDALTDLEKAQNQVVALRLELDALNKEARISTHFGFEISEAEIRKAAELRRELASAVDEFERLDSAGGDSSLADRTAERWGKVADAITAARDEAASFVYGPTPDAPPTVSEFAEQASAALSGAGQGTANAVAAARDMALAVQKAFIQQLQDAAFGRDTTLLEVVFGKKLEFTSDASKGLYDSLQEQIVQLRGNAQEILDREFEGLEAQISEVAIAGNETRALQELVESYKDLAQAKLDASQAKAVAREQEQAIKAESDRIKGLIADYSELERALEQLAQVAADSPADLIALDLAENEKQRGAVLALTGELAELGVTADQVNAAFDRQADKITGEAFEGVEASVRGAKDALDEFVQFVRDDQARAYDLVSDGIQTFRSSFSSAFADFATGAASAQEASDAFFRSLLGHLVEVASTAAIDAALAGVLEDLDFGGPGDASEDVTTLLAAIEQLRAASGDLEVSLQAVGTGAGEALQLGGEAAGLAITTAAEEAAATLSGFAGGGGLPEGIQGPPEASVAAGADLGGEVAGGADLAAAQALVAQLEGAISALGPAIGGAAGELSTAALEIKLAAGAIVTGADEASTILSLAGQSLAASMVKGATEAAAILAGESTASTVSSFIGPPEAEANGAINLGGLGSLTALANGGIIQRGISDAIAYANGGPIVRAPHVALVGEGRYDEAVVPLPNGRELPVDLRTDKSAREQRMSDGGPRSVTTINVSPTIELQVVSLDPRTAAQLIQEPSTMKAIQAGIADALSTGANQALTQSVRNA